MLAPLIVNLLIASLTILFAGWLGDILRSSTHGSPKYAGQNKVIGWAQLPRPSSPLPYSDPASTWRPRSVCAR